MKDIESQVRECLEELLFGRPQTGRVIKSKEQEQRIGITATQLHQIYKEYYEKEIEKTSYILGVADGRKQMKEEIRQRLPKEEELKAIINKAVGDAFNPPINANMKAAGIIANACLKAVREGFNG